MRLNVYKLCAEQLLCAGDCNILHNVDALASAVIPFAGVALRIFVCQHRAHRRHNGRRDDVLTGDQFKIAALAGKLRVHRVADFLIIACNKANGIH